jgi:hypothetical protein
VDVPSERLALIATALRLHDAINVIDAESRRRLTARLDGVTDARSIISDADVCEAGEWILPDTDACARAQLWSIQHALMDYTWCSYGHSCSLLAPTGYFGRIMTGSGGLVCPLCRRSVGPSALPEADHDVVRVILLAPQIGTKTRLAIEAISSAECDGFAFDNLILDEITCAALLCESDAMFIRGAPHGDEIIGARGSTEWAQALLRTDRMSLRELLQTLSRATDKETQRLRFKPILAPIRSDRFFSEPTLVTVSPPDGATSAGASVLSHWPERNSHTWRSREWLAGCRMPMGMVRLIDWDDFLLAVAAARHIVGAVGVWLRRDVVPVPANVDIDADTSSGDAIEEIE